MKTLILTAALMGSFAAATAADGRQKAAQKDPVRKQFNPKEVGVDKSVPWQKTAKRPSKLPRG